MPAGYHALVRTSGIVHAWCCRTCLVSSYHCDCVDPAPSQIPPPLYGAAQLLEWLQRPIFPEELKYADRDYSRNAARHFFDALLAAVTLGKTR